MHPSEESILFFSKNIIMVGFGCIGQAMLPFLFHHFRLTPQQLTILSKSDEGTKIAEEYGVTLEVIALTEDNYQTVLANKLKENDFLLNLSVDVASIDLIRLAQAKGALYLDTCTEPWEGGYVGEEMALRTNYALREAILALKKTNKPTAVITHGANPGLISHFVKQALVNMSEENFIRFNPHTTNNQEWANLSEQLGIKVIHGSEYDTQVTNQPKQPDEFVNTWSVDGFISECLQPAELGWGTHERHWPSDALAHTFGSNCAIYLKRPGATTRVRTWTPNAKAFHGFLITHAETISIANYLTKADAERVYYRPTVHYAYHPAADCVLSLNEFAGKEWQLLERKRLSSTEIIEGIDELGALLMGNTKGAYWYGSQLSIHEARHLMPYNNATTLQVCAGILGGMFWAIEHPNEGVVEPEDMDYQAILKIAHPYLGTVAGYFTDWNPIKNREKLYQETLDVHDPWQFLNIRV